MNLEAMINEKQAEIVDPKDFYQWLETEARDRLNKMQAVVEAARIVVSTYGRIKSIQKLEAALRALDGKDNPNTQATTR